MQIHVCRTIIGPQRCCQSTDRIWHLRNTKNRRLLWFSEQIGNRGRKRKITSGQSENIFGFWTKNCPPKPTQKQFCMEFFIFKAEKGSSTQSMPSLLWYSMVRSALRPSNFLTYIN